MGSNVAAIPEDATTMAILFCERILANKRVIKNVLPVPLGASKKYTPPALVFTLSMSKRDFVHGLVLVHSVVSYVEVQLRRKSCAEYILCSNFQQSHQSLVDMVNHNDGVCCLLLKEECLVIETEHD
ncbi:hypothetical protein ABEB36_010672 [Hypothenemus hampei]|uniref:Uncharacterized protein n=1 Tax=Hypothenemus hampei TaxID=57062 RepID=A0ABD1ECT6_HYPHA